MLEKILKSPAIRKYLHAFQAGETIFVEGDETEDLYILVDGVLDVIKGRNKIGEVSEKGSPFGEMSFLLGGKRTATIKANSDAEVICIAKSEISRFLDEFPDFAKTITELLARRLDQQTQISFGLREFCDQLPDAVIVTDREGKILSWNRSAEELYGRGWEEMRGRGVQEIYEEASAYEALLNEVSDKHTVKEKVLRIRHPVKGVRFISMSTTFLYDGHQNFQGMIALGRDLTPMQKLERKYRKILYWILGPLIFFGLLSTGVYFEYPHFFKNRQPLTVSEKELKRVLASDFLLLKQLLQGPLANVDRRKTREIMREFFAINENAAQLYKGLALLDADKKVFEAYPPPDGSEMKNPQGMSFETIPFRGPKESVHKWLVFYWQDRNHAMGHKHTAIAFELTRGGDRIGWLILSLDMDHVKEAYGMDGGQLEKLKFKKP